MTSRVVAPQGSTTTTKPKRQPRVAFPWKRSLLPPTTFAGGARNHPMGIEDAVAMDDDGTMISPAGLSDTGPTPYSLRLASSARKRPRTTEERFALSFSCDAVAMPTVPLGPEDLPESFVMINVPQEVPGMSITGFSVEIVTEDASSQNDDASSVERTKHAMLADTTKAGVVVEVVLKTLDKVGRAIHNERPVIIATFGDRAAASKPHTTNASYDGSVGDIPISCGQHMMLYAIVRPPYTSTNTSASPAQVEDALTKVISSSKVVVHIIGHVVLPPAEEEDNVGVSSRNTSSMTTCPRREARKFINKVYQRSSTQVGAATLVALRSIMMSGLAQAQAVETTITNKEVVSPVADVTSSSSSAPVLSPKAVAVITKQQAASPTASGKSPSAAEKARNILLKRREATADGTPSKTARKGLVPGSGKKRQ